MKSFSRWTIICLAVVAFLAPLKWGTPVVMQALTEPPRGFWEWLLSSWPNGLGVLFCFGALMWGLADSQRAGVRRDVLFFLPLIWLATQWLAFPDSIQRQTSLDTLLHFSTCTLLFYTAAWYVRDGASAAEVFGGLGLAVALVCVFGLQQWFGGLAETRQSVDLSRLPPEYALRLASDRVFSTLVYPNALAGFLVVAFAPVLAWIWVRGRSWNETARWGALVLAVGMMVTTLVLTGSRGGFLAFAVGTIIGVWCFVGRRTSRTTGIVLLVLALLAGLFWMATRSGLIGLGSSSLAARFDYWEGAVAIGREHPLTGTGPGTFGSIYPRYKTGQTEEAQLVHNNFLQMWSDSGLVACVAFAAMWLWGVRDALRLAEQRHGDAAAVAVAAALIGWTVHGLVDFDLYVPGVAFPAFILLGTLQGLKESERSEVPARKWTVGLCGIVVLGIALAEGRALGAMWAHGQMYALERTDPLDAFDEGQRAVQLAPWNSHYLSQVGDLAMQLRRTDEAVAFYQAAIRQDRYRPSYHWRLARVLWVQGGHEQEALAELERAVELNPTNKKYLDDLTMLKETVRQGKGRLLDSAPNE